MYKQNTCKNTWKKTEEKTKFSKILPNNQIITSCRIKLWVQEMTMNEKLTMIGLIIESCKVFCKIVVRFPEDIETLHWCPAGPVLPHGEKTCLFSLVWPPSSSGITIKIPYREDVLLHRLASHPIFSYGVG